MQITRNSIAKSMKNSIAVNKIETNFSWREFACRQGCLENSLFLLMAFYLSMYSFVPERGKKMQITAFQTEIESTLHTILFWFRHFWSGEFKKRAEKTEKLDKQPTIQFKLTFTSKFLSNLITTLERKRLETENKEAIKIFPQFPHWPRNPHNL